MAAAPPDAPTSVVAAQIGATAAVHVDWVPGFDGGSPITSYTATATPGGLTCTSSASPPDAFCDITGLSVGVSYTVAVIATNGSGDSLASADSAAVLVATVPNPPTAVSAAAVGSTTSVDVSWVAPVNDGGSAITGYTATSTPGSHACATAGTVCTVTGLTRGVTYTFTVVAANGLGNSAPSAASAGVFVPTVPRHP